MFIEDKWEMNPALECTAVVLNINLGKNRELMEKCKQLREYAEFIATIRKYLAEGMQFEKSVEIAVDNCIKNGILADVLQKNRAEVVDMILTEYDEEEFRKALREDLRNEGLAEGIKATIRICMKCDISKDQARKNLMEEFSLPQEEIEKYLDKYWK